MRIAVVVAAAAAVVEVSDVVVEEEEEQQQLIEDKGRPCGCSGGCTCRSRQQQLVIARMRSSCPLRVD